jgi:uncharacterized membrane protein
MEHDSNFDLETLSSYILRFGVALSCFLIAVGVVALLDGDRTSAFPQNLQELLSTNYAKPTLDPSTLIKGIITFNPLFILQLGMLVLLVTPILRIIASTLFFAIKKDGIYLAVTLFILLVIFLSIFLVGPLEAAGRTQSEIRSFT